MGWSFGRARRAAAQIRTASLGRDAAGTVRPRSIFGIVRARAPLSLLIFAAAQDGLVVAADGGGFAVLQRPASGAAVRSSGYRLRLLRWLDRRWDFVVFCGPPAFGLVAAALTALFEATRVASLVLLVVSVLWVCVFMTSMLATQVRWIARAGVPSGTGRGRAAESLPFIHWSVPLLHQPDPARIDELLGLLTERLADLVRADLQMSAGDRVRVGRAQVTETLIVLTHGVTTEAARIAIAESLRAVQRYPAEGDVVVLAAPAPLDRVPAWPVASGSFLLLYMAALAIIVAVGALFVASSERTACAPSVCSGRPATYTLALRYLLQRLLLTDPPGLGPATTWVIIFGWFMSIAAIMIVPVAIVAARQELARNRQANAQFDETIGRVTQTARILILVVTEGERDAVLAAVNKRTGRPGVIKQGEGRTIYALGPVGGAELMLAQAGEQGTSAAAGMFVTAREAIGECRPDYVILTGICYGLRPDGGQQIGDIVVARRVQNADHRKVSDDERRQVVYRGVNVGCSTELLDRIQAGQRAWSQVAVHIGTVLSSNTLINSRRVIGQLREDFPDAIAGEMEGTGVYEAVTLDYKPEWIIVKGISDWGYDKTKAFQELAAQNAAEFVTHVIANGALRRRRAMSAP